MAIRFLQTNRYTASTTTLTASTSQAALPVAASQNPDRSYVWRSLQQVGVQTIDIDLGSVLDVTTVAVANVKLLGSSALELHQRGDAASPGAAVLVATLATQDADTRAVAAFFTQQSHRHWQLKWTTAGGSDYAELGYAFLGTYLETSVQTAPPTFSRADPSVARFSLDRQATFAQRTSFAYGDWEWRGIREQSDVDLLRTLYRTFGRRAPFFAVFDTSKSWTTWLCRLTSDVVITPINNPASNWYCNVRVGWEEAA